MSRGFYKKISEYGFFTDFKHHSSSWKNNKKIRARKERRILKKEESNDPNSVI